MDATVVFLQRSGGKGGCRSFVLLTLSKHNLSSSAPTRGGDDYELPGVCLVYESVVNTVNIVDILIPQFVLFVFYCSFAHSAGHRHFLISLHIPCQHVTNKLILNLDIYRHRDMRLNVVSLVSSFQSDNTNCYGSDLKSKCNK